MLWIAGASLAVGGTLSYLGWRQKSNGKAALGACGIGIGLVLLIAKAVTMY